ncbi:MAG: hypothetical protein VB082_02420 [Christensenella sp.]|nr:hypothetical protein [Christensenella sp.]
MENNNNTLAIIALILGIVSLVCAFLFWPVGLICGIVGLILGSKARKSAPGGMATAGFVLSIIGLILSVVLLIVIMSCMAVVGGMALSLAAIA